MKQQLDILQILLDAGIVVKLVLLVLLIGSVISWAIAILKRNKMNIIESENQKFLDQFDHVKDLDDIMQLSREFKNSTLSIMLDHGHREISQINRAKQKAGNATLLNVTTLIERALRHGRNSSNALLTDRLGLLASIGSIAPFVGLFGTVWGIIESFRGLSSGGGTIESVAPGIAEALVATAIGLFVAIPAVLFFNTLGQRVKNINGVMDSFEQDFLNFVERNLYIKESKKDGNEQPGT
jgi:biopolymer transport protein TolQ